MDFLSSLFVAKPLNIFVVAVLFLAGYLVLRFTELGANRHPRPLIIASMASGLYAAWELMVLIKTSEEKHYECKKLIADLLLKVEMLTNL